VSNLKAEAQFLVALIEQQDGENLVINDPFYHFRNTLKQSIKIQRGIQDVSHFNEKCFNIYTLRSGGADHSLHVQ